jgi:hypothetical protein
MTAFRAYLRRNALWLSLSLAFALLPVVVCAIEHEREAVQVGRELQRAAMRAQTVCGMMLGFR